MYAGIHVRNDCLPLVEDAIAILKMMAETNSYAEHSASVLGLLLHAVRCQNHARIVNPRLQGQADQIKTEPITAYESSQYRSPFYPAAHGSLAPSHINRRRSTIENYTAIKKESPGRLNTLGSMPFSLPMVNNTFHPQFPSEHPQHPWCNEHSGNMDFDMSRRM